MTKKFGTFELLTNDINRIIMDDLSYLANSEVNAIDELYAQYKKNPDSLDISWRKFLHNFSANIYY